jgi:hypothetical protein
MKTEEKSKYSLWLLLELGKSKHPIPAGIRTRDLWIRSPTRYPLRYRDLIDFSKSELKNEQSKFVTLCFLKG